MAIGEWYVVGGFAGGLRVTVGALGGFEMLSLVRMGPLDPGQGAHVTPRCLTTADHRLGVRVRHHRPGLRDWAPFWYVAKTGGAEWGVGRCFE